MQVLIIVLVLMLVAFALGYVITGLGLSIKRRFRHGDMKFQRWYRRKQRQQVLDERPVVIETATGEYHLPGDTHRFATVELAVECHWRNVYENQEADRVTSTAMLIAEADYTGDLKAVLEG